MEIDNQQHKETIMMNERLENPDEIVLENVKLFHAEQMNEKSLWVGCYTEDNRIFHLNISAKGGKLKYYWSEETVDK